MQNVRRALLADSLKNTRGSGGDGTNRASTAIDRPRSFMNTPKRHPHFDDRGTLSWNTRWNDALSQAQAENKKIFIELGREL